MANGTGSIFSFSDLYNLYNVVQSTSSVVMKQLVIAQLRDFFSRDSFYHYQADEWGFPKNIDLTDTAPEIGLHDSGSTRVYIGEYYRYQGIYYPAILVKSGSIKYLPLSINRERETIVYDLINVIDGYGNIKTFRTPSAFVFAGFWSGNIDIEIWARHSIRTRDDLVDLIMLLFSDIGFQEMEKSGIIITGVSSGSPTEGEDRNDKIFKQTISLSVQSHWRREIPINNLVEAINICVEFADNLAVDPPHFAPNLAISTRVDLLGEIQNL